MSPRRITFRFVASALLVAIAVRVAYDDLRFILPCIVAIALAVLPAFLARRRVRRILMSGDVEQVLGTWRPTMARVTYPETMTPLMMATAYASCGWIEAARDALDRARKGPAWEAALEQRLFVETLLDTFEGDRAAALEKAESLEKLPIPRAAGRFARARIVRLRKAMHALARAFAHQSGDGDLRALRRASRSSPLIHWATRYAAAVIAIDRGKRDVALALIEDAPTWPNESAFRTFDEELRARATA